jgi:GDP-L-fucose synthase
MNSKKTRILITGGSGLVGSALKKISIDYANNDFFFVSSKQYNLTDYNECNKMFYDNKPDIVIHLAAYVGGLYKNMNHKVSMFENNIIINYNVLKCAYQYGVKKLVACLSTCIFPDITTYPIKESFLHNGPPHFSNDAYAYSKRMLEVQCRLYRENFGANYVCIIPTNIYGEHDNFSIQDAHVIPALIHKCYLAKKNNDKFIVFGSGKPLRQFIYSEDLAKLILWTVNNFNSDNIILSGSEEISIREIATSIASYFDMEKDIIFDTSFSDGQFMKTADNSKLMGLIGDFNFVSIKDGISKVCEWFVNNYNNDIRL